MPAPLEFIRHCRAVGRWKLKQGDINTEASYYIEELAKELEIAPGIVAGRLQFDKIWLPVVGNNLKHRYKIEDLLASETNAAA